MDSADAEHLETPHRTAHSEDNCIRGVFPLRGDSRSYSRGLGSMLSITWQSQDHGRCSRLSIDFNFPQYVRSLKYPVSVIQPGEGTLLTGILTNHKGLFSLYSF